MIGRGKAWSGMAVSGKLWQGFPRQAAIGVQGPDAGVFGPRQDLASRGWLRRGKAGLGAVEWGLVWLGLLSKKGDETCLFVDLLIG